MQGPFFSSAAIVSVSVLYVSLQTTLLPAWPREATTLGTLDVDFSLQDYYIKSATKLYWCIVSLGVLRHVGLDRWIFILCLLTLIISHFYYISGSFFPVSLSLSFCLLLTYT